MVRTTSHGYDTPRVPIGDVLIKCCSPKEHCDNERGWERVGIHSNNSLLLMKIVLIEIKRKKEECKHEKNKDGYKNINNKQQKENG